MTEAERERLSRNLAEVIDDLYRQARAATRSRAAHPTCASADPLRHVACGTQRAPRPGAAAMTDIPHDHLGQPDLQALGDLSVGH
jgi:hypothetical protein